MNICFFIGKICSEIGFNFILNSKDISIAVFDLELLNGSIVKVKAYNEIADYCYSNLEKGTNIQVKGYINGEYETILEELNFL